MVNKLWKEYKGKNVRLIVLDISTDRYTGESKEIVKPKDGIFIDSDDTHIFLQLEHHKIATPFLKSSIKRIEMKENEELNGTTDVR